MELAYFFSRANRAVSRNRPKWERIEQAYAGGAEYIPIALIRHVAENRLEYAERIRRAYYLNYPRRLAELITTYIFSVEPTRPQADSELIADWSRDGLTADGVMQEASIHLTLFGLCWLLVDYPAVSGELDLEAKKQQGIRPFVRALSPFRVPDWSEGADGKFDWAIVEEKVEHKPSPYERPVTAIRRRLWTRTDWILYERIENGDYKEIGRAAHNLGEVPLVKLTEPFRAGLHTNHWFEDIVRISDAIMNNESEAQMNTVKQMFGILVVSEEFARGQGQMGDSETAENEDPAKKEKFSHVLARSAAIWETAEEKNLTRYIHPDGAETATIRSENQALKREMYDIVGMAAQSQSREAQTAESKAWDANSVQRFLSSRAGLFEQAEQRCWKLMSLWDSGIAVPDVSYNREFSVQDLSAMVTAVLDLSSVEAGDEFTREIARSAVDLLDKVRRISPDTYQKIIKEIDVMEIQKFHIPEQQIPVDDADKNDDDTKQED